MATVLDVGLLNYFSVVYPFLIVFAIVFALLQKTKVIGESMGINALLAVVMGILVIISKTATEMINFMAPWFVVVVIFLVLMLFVFQTMGAKDADIASAVKDKAVYWTLIGIALLILVAAFGKVMGQSLTEASVQSGETALNVTGEGGVATGDFQQNIYATLFHPKVLGLMVLFGIAIFTVAFLSAG